MDMKKIKKGLLSKKIRITSHAKIKMKKRGYSRSDIISCIWSGEITEIQVFQRKIRAVIEGKDMDDLPIVLIIGKDDENPKNLTIVTVFPPIKKKFKRII